MSPWLKFIGYAAIDLLCVVLLWIGVPFGLEPIGWVVFVGMWWSFFRMVAVLFQEIIPEKSKSSHMNEGDS